MPENREDTCCFTGHRVIPAGKREGLRASIREVIGDLYELGVNRYITGGALGFDTYAALEIIEFKKLHPEVSLCLELPCRDQWKGWRAGEIAQYNEILARADEVSCFCETYEQGCMYARNRRMVDKSAYCVAYQTKPTGGSAYTVGYAKKQNIRVIRLYA